MTATPDRSRGRGWAQALALALGSGVCLGLAWPGRGMPLLAFAFLVPHFAAVRDASVGRRAGLAWLAGSVAAGLSAGEATAATLASYFELEGLPLALAWIAAHQLLGALPFVGFALLVGDVDRSTPWRTFGRVGSAWVLSEALRDILFPGAWLSLASALARLPELIQSAAWIGQAGVSFWIAGLGGLAYHGLLGAERRRSGAAAALVIAALVAQAAWTRTGSLSAGGVDLEPPPVTEASIPHSLQIVLVQSGVDSRDRSDRPSDAQDLARLLELSAGSARVADLIVWPESAVRGLWPANAGLLDREVMNRLSARALLLGTPWLETTPTGGVLAVAAVLVDEEGQIAGRHLKTRLVPLAEDRRLISALGLGGEEAAYSPAKSAMLLPVGTAQIGVSICYEALFGSIARNQARRGAGLFVQLSNESWLGESRQGRDHMLAAATLRAIENRRPVLRATPTGHTAALDARGRIVARLAPDQPGVLRLRVIPASGSTLYSRFGPTPIIALAVVTTAMGRAGERRRARLGSPRAS
jgi:apolipoprotein N-acyltransferase